jgi:hypothetical protein
MMTVRNLMRIVIALAVVLGLVGGAGVRELRARPASTRMPAPKAATQPARAGQAPVVKTDCNEDNDDEGEDASRVKPGKPDNDDVQEECGDPRHEKASKHNRAEGREHEVATPKAPAALKTVGAGK